MDLRNPFDAEAQYLASDLPKTGWMADVPPDESIRGADFFSRAGLGNREAARLALEDAGYDGIRYAGGRYAGDGMGPMHDVYVAWNPAQVYSGMRPQESVRNPMVNPLLATLAGQNAVRPWGE